MTLDRIAVVIQVLTGVTLSNPSVWRLLRGRLGWSVQRPQRQASERDEEAIQHWVAHAWPRIKKGPRRIGLACLLRRIGHLAGGCRTLARREGWAALRKAGISRHLATAVAAPPP